MEKKQLFYESYKISESIRQMIQEEREWNRAALGFATGFLGGIVYTLVLYLI